MTVVVVGAGTIGSVAVRLLAGHARTRVIDRDFIDALNLERQTFYGRIDVGKSKAVVAAEKLGADGVCDEVTADTVARLIGKPALVLDCTDNMATRFVINDYCLRERVPWIYAGAVEDRGIVFAIGREGKPCFRCLVPHEPGPLETCDLEGVDV
ncbi:MAG: ThiF family adenylyltransferase, partial [Candidatus Aenigmarchaeota archaeon]|nr:ThiF family adenylyltransferase [Candidatus Aenigmarchaeota archaeon]